MVGETSPKLHCQCPIIGQIIQWPWNFFGRFFGDRHTLSFVLRFNFSVCCLLYFVDTIMPENGLLRETTNVALKKMTVISHLLLSRLLLCCYKYYSISIDIINCENARTQNLCAEWSEEPNERTQCTACYCAQRTRSKKKKCYEGGCLYLYADITRHFYMDMVTGLFCLLPHPIMCWLCMMGNIMLWVRPEELPERWHWQKLFFVWFFSSVSSVLLPHHSRRSVIKS